MIKMEKSIEQKLLQLYLESPYGLSTAERLHKGSRQINLNVSLRQVKEAMRKWKIASQFQKKYVKQAKSEKGIVPGPFHLFQVDLCIMQKYRGFIGILVW